jgi:nucleoside-diphosphate-sugar epimerase
MRLAITGASGWLGKNFIDQIFLQQKLPEEFDVKLFASSNKTISVGHSDFFCQEFNLINLLNFKPTHIIHLAFNFKNKNLYRNNNLTVNNKIINIITRYLETEEVQKIIFTSSGAQESAIIKDDLKDYVFLKSKETQLIIDICKKNKIEYNKLNIWNCSGKYPPDLNTYFFINFIYKCINGLPIYINSANQIYRSFTSAGSIAELGTKLLTGSGPSNINCSQLKYIEIEEYANRVKSFLKSQSSVSRVDLNPDEEDDRYFPLSSNFDQICEKLDVKLFTLDEQISITSDFIKGSVSGFQN